MGISYFSGGTLARLSDGSYCIIRDLGLVKGGKGLRHFQCLLRFGLFSKLIEIFDRPRGYIKFNSSGRPPEYPPPSKRWKHAMKEVTDYLARAKECREMMERALPEQKAALEQIAKTWEKLAEERKTSVGR